MNASRVPIEIRSPRTCSGSSAAVIAAKSEDDALVEVGALLEILGAIAGMDQRVLEAAE